MRLYNVVKSGSTSGCPKTMARHVPTERKLHVRQNFALTQSKINKIFHKSVLKQTLDTIEQRGLFCSAQSGEAIVLLLSGILCIIGRRYIIINKIHHCKRNPDVPYRRISTGSPLLRACYRFGAFSTGQILEKAEDDIFGF